MCQLILINTNSIQLNRLFLYNQLQIDSNISNKDGTGMYQKDSTIFKSKEAASNIDNLADVIVFHVTNKNPVLAHVRQASNRLSIDDKNAHPLETKKLVLAHNGILTPNKEISDKYKDMIDTEVFLKELDVRYTGTNMGEALNETMKLFTGPFAFLIYSKMEGTYYAVRGKNRPLHVSNIKMDDKIIGYMINTDKRDLELGLKLEANLFNLGGKSRLTYDEATLLEDNSIYRLHKFNLSKIGTIKENEPVKVILTNTIINTLSTRLRTPLEKIVNFILGTGLTFSEVDNLMYAIFGMGLLYIGNGDKEDFVDFCMPLLGSMYSDNKKALWTNIVHESNPEMNILDIYTEHSINFPYFINKSRTLKNVLCKIKEDKKRNSTVKVAK